MPCEYVSLDVTDITGMNSHNITKDILKWRLDDKQQVLKDTSAMVAEEHRGLNAHALAIADEFDDRDEDEDEPEDTNLSQPLTPDSFVPFMRQHELTLVNFYAPWCIWCRRLEPVYLETASKVPELHFHGHARLSQVDCVEHQDFCGKQMIPAYPTLRMYKDADPVNFELFTGARTTEAILGFVQLQMSNYRKSHKVLRKHDSARFEVKHGSLTGGTDLYKATMSVQAASSYCGNNVNCLGFTWEEPQNKDASTGDPLVFFKGGDRKQQVTNNDLHWSSYIKIANAAEAHSAPGSLLHGPEGCMIAGHLQVRKVPGTLRLVLHSPGHDHEGELINSSHVVNGLWFGDPLTPLQRSRLSTADQLEIASPTSHLLEGLAFSSIHAGHSHVHYLKVVTKVIKHVKSKIDTIVYKYTVHSNKFEADKNMPSVDLKYDLSPISIVSQQVGVPTYRFITSTCAIIGGVFTVIGLLENVIHHTAANILKKQT